MSTAITSHHYPEGLRYAVAGIGYCEERDLDSWTRYMQSWQVVALAGLVPGKRQQRWPADYWISGSHPGVRCPGRGDTGPAQLRRGSPAAEHLELAETLALATGELQRIAPAACAAAEGSGCRAAGTDRGATQAAIDLVPDHPDPWVEGEWCWWRSLGGVSLETGRSRNPSP